MQSSRTNDILLDPVRQIRAADGAYLSLGTDPSFAVLSTRAYPAGWCRISYRGRAVRGCLSPRLLVENGAGFAGPGYIELPPSCGQRVTAVRRLPARVASLHLFPTDAPGRFSIEDFEIRPLSHAQLLLEIGLRALRRAIADPLRLGAFGRAAWRTWRNGKGGSLKIRVARWLEQSETDYHTWVACYDLLDDDARAAIRRRIAAFRQRPVFSILTTVFDAPEDELRGRLESVLEQIYPHWELCIADLATPNAKLHDVLEEYRLRDPRIRIALGPEHGGPAAASNTALGLASGEYVIPLGQGCILSEHACYLMAEALDADPHLDLVYSDEDEIGATGHRCAPRFKGDWDPDLLLQQSYMGRVCLYRADRVRKLGGFRSGYEGSEPYDLTLRYAAQTEATRIYHLPFVLFHTRAGATERFGDPGDASEAAHSDLRAVEDHLKAIAPDARVENAALPGIYRVRYALPVPPPRVTVIIPTRNGATLVRRCVESIVANTSYAPYEILLVDNGSDDPGSTRYFDELERSGAVRLVRYEGCFNYSAINNFAVGQAAGELLVLLNNDTEVIGPDWLTELVSQAVRPDIGAVGAKLLYPDGTIQHAGIVMGLHGTVGHAHRCAPGDSSGYWGSLAVAREVAAVTGACLALRKGAYEEVGGLDERNLPVTFNDIDLCLKLRAKGYRNIWTPHAVLYHHEAATRGPEDNPEKAARYRMEFDFMQAKWGARMLADPFFSPNLSLASEDYRPAFPPRCCPPWLLDDAIHASKQA